MSCKPSRIASSLRDRSPMRRIPISSISIARCRSIALACGRDAHLASSAVERGDEVFRWRPLGQKALATDATPSPALEK